MPIITFNELPDLREAYADQSIALGEGTFDLLNGGHLEYLERLRDFGRITVVAVSSNEEAAQLKGPDMPLNDQADRLVVVNGIRHVDYCLIAPDPNLSAGRFGSPVAQIIKALKPNTLVTSNPSNQDYADEFSALGTELAFIPRSPLNSTSRVIERIATEYSAR